MNSKIEINKCLFVLRDNQYSYVLNGTGRHSNDSIFTNNTLFFKPTTSKSRNGKPSLFRVHNNNVQVDLNGYAIFPLELLTNDQKVALIEFNKQNLNSYNPINIPSPHNIL